MVPWLPCGQTEGPWSSLPPLGVKVTPPAAAAAWHEAELCWELLGPGDLCREGCSARHRAVLLSGLSSVHLPPASLETIARS